MNDLLDKNLPDENLLDFEAVTLLDSPDLKCPGAG
jgi:hypothetical protein